MRYGYIMEHITPGTESLMKERMLALGCQEVIMEPAGNGYTRRCWKQLAERLSPGDELVCYDISHLATDDRMLRELKGVCLRSRFRLFTMLGLRPADGLVEHPVSLIDEIMAFLCGSRKRMMAVMDGIRAQVVTDFPDVSPKVREKIFATFCLAQGISEVDLYQAIGNYAPENVRRLRQWMLEDCSKELKGNDLKKYKAELSIQMGNTSYMI